MIEDLIYRLTDTTPNARRLLALLFAVFVPMLVVFTMVLPLAEARRDGRAALAEAEALYLWVHAQASALPPAAFVAEAAPETAADGPAGISQLETSLMAAGMRDDVSRLSNRQSGVVEIAFEEVDFAGFIAWIEAASPNWGYDFARLSVERAAAPGRVSAALELAPRP